MLCWPIYSAGTRGSLFVALIPGINIIRMLLLGSGILKDEGTVKSMSRFGDRREFNLIEEDEISHGSGYQQEAVHFGEKNQQRETNIGIRIS